MPVTFYSMPQPPANLCFDQVTLRFLGVIPGDERRGLVPFYHFRILSRRNTDVGHINFRIGETDHVRLYAGHIGYQVEKRFRGNRYAFQACCAIAPFVKAIYPKVILTCDPDNEASRKTIERLGARFIEEIAIPPEALPLHLGSVAKLRYEWEP
jgi:predicted acetyltransferase